MSTFVKASHVPLFDRLCGQDPAWANARLLEANGLQESLRRDLLRLLNVRNGLTVDQFLACEGTVLHYGLPDLLALCVQSDTDLERLAQVVRHGIELFEPRLQAVSVRARRDARSPERALLALSASAVVGRELQRVDFDVDLQEQAARVVAAA